MKEKVFIRRIHYSNSHVCILDYDTFSDVWSTVGCFGFSPYGYKVRVPYSVDNFTDFFGDDIISGPSYLIWSDDKNQLKGIENNGNFLRTDISYKKIYSDEFINKMMKENFGDIYDK